MQIVAFAEYSLPAIANLQFGDALVWAILAYSDFPRGSIDYLPG